MNQLEFKFPIHHIITKRINYREKGDYYNEKNVTQGLSTKEKIQKTSNVIKVLFRIAKIGALVGACICAAAAIFTMLAGDENLIVLNGDVILRSPFSADFLEKYDGWKLISLEIALTVSLLLMTRLFKIASEIFEDISISSTPFKIENVTRIKKVAILYLIISLFDIEDSITSAGITLNAMGIMGAVMFWCIALIFEYGCELQKELDETL